MSEGPAQKYGFCLFYSTSGWFAADSAYSDASERHSHAYRCYRCFFREPTNRYGRAKRVSEDYNHLKKATSLLPW